MYTALHLSAEEREIARRVDNYFKTPHMNFRDKVFNALLIAQHELESHHFSTEDEKLKIIYFRNTLYSLLKKLDSANMR
ncbi:hypothetical protein SAMN02745221_00577 [Thermosyntropha lipolytica DSM 11003]|uniref:Uncharacterized protein n=1 Tax=Thermosyntropha lipolytica DSM 11003 TaxID=1123382 RepID=A0A1M5L716_9FIRM|nr:hypothetical protein [Thermosyntropha lipolytica]SHG60756.1 hypothetical protein SAMN02745221_00577 [Thermosyntropha lipolytica DSM 11003]